MSRRLLLALILAASCLVPVASFAGADADIGDGGTASARPASPFTTWSTYHGSTSRSGHVTKGVPRATLQRAWTKDVGEVDGEPIMVGDTLVAAGQDNVVHGLNAATGHERWQVSLGTPVPDTTLECGYLEAIGIIGTPAYDARTNSLFVVAETTGGVHTLWALNPATGRKKWSRNLDVMPDQDPLSVKNRAAILVAHGRVYVSFGSAGANCGAYVGYLTATPTSGRGGIVEYHTPTTNNGGMWTPAGPVLGRNGSIYMAVGQGSAVEEPYDMTDSVTELDPETLKVRSFFAPSTWATDNRDDLDLGSMSPAQLPDLRRMVIAGKAGTVYLLPERLKGIGSELDSLTGCHAYAGSAVVRDNVIINCQVDRRIRKIRVTADSISYGWTSPVRMVGSPVVAGDRVYVPDRVANRLYVLRLSNGHVLQQLPLPETTHFPTVMVDGGYVFVNTLHGVTAFR